MEHEGTRRPGLIGYDERTETWFVRSADSQKLMLTRQSLAHLVDMYNSVHTGRPIVLVEERELRRLLEAGHRVEETRAHAAAATHRRPAGLLPRFVARLRTSLAAAIAPPRHPRPR
jgi:hypothetical protein